MTIFMDDYQNKQFTEVYSSFFALNNTAEKKKLDVEGLIKQLNNLNIHGILTPYNKSTNKYKNLHYKRIYYFPVFQQEILKDYIVTKNNSDTWVNSSLFKDKEKVSLKEINRFYSKREERRVKRLAIRAVYALNLDYGIAKIGVTGGEKLWVLYVDSYPESNIRLAKLFEDAIKKFTVEWDKNIKSNNKNTLIGCDPEFILQRTDGKIVMANRYLPRNGEAGCDRVWLNHDRNQLPIAELRPNPEHEPRDLIINLYNCMLLCSKKITDKKLKWLAGSMPMENFPLGGHIHFSNIWLNSFVLRALDNYLAITIALFEDNKASSRKHLYGFLGGYRKKNYGGFEYRTLPSWLLSPTITKGVFALAKLIAENYLYLYQNPLADIKIQIAYYNGDKSILRLVQKRLWNEMEQLKDYEKYEKYLNPLKKLIDSNFVWDESTDIRKVWLLPPYNKLNNSTKINKKK